MIHLLRLTAANREYTHVYALIEWEIPAIKNKLQLYNIQIPLYDPPIRFILPQMMTERYISYIIERSGFLRWLLRRPRREHIWTVKIV